MKTKTKKCGVLAALAAVLLVSAVLIISCPEAISPGGLTVPKTEDRQLFEPPPGMGFIVFDIDVEKFAARTTLPTTTTYDALSKFPKVEVYISGGDGGSYSDMDWDKTSGIPVRIDGDDYTVTVVGYNGATSTAVAVALGSNTVNVAGATATVNITMKEITTGTHAGVGTLALALNNDFGVTTATANITSLTGGSSNVTGSDALTVSSHSLLPGYYRLELTLVKANHQSIVYREIILIWSGMTTTYTRILTLNSTLHAVVYDFNDDRDTDATPPVLASDTKSFTHGADFDHPDSGQPTAYLDSSNDPVGGFVWGGWWTADGSGNPAVWGTQWEIATTKVIRPITLYARWNPSTPNAQITIGTPVTVSFSNVDKPISITTSLTLGGAAIASLTITQPSLSTLYFSVDTPNTLTAPITYTWKYSGDLGGALLAATTSSSASANFSVAPYNVAGPQAIQLEIQDADGYYNIDIPVTVSY